MKFYCFTPALLKEYFNRELNLYRDELAAGNLSVAWRHLERAHIIGQAYPFAHSRAHWEMLKFGIKIKSAKEIVGQIPRLLIGGVKSFVGKIPVGNTGGADVAPLNVMEIPYDLEILNSADASR